MMMMCNSLMTIEYRQPKTEKNEDPLIVEARKHYDKAELFKRYKAEVSAQIEENLLNATEEEKGLIVEDYVKKIDVCDRTVDKCNRRYDEVVEKLVNKK